MFFVGRLSGHAHAHEADYGGAGVREIVKGIGHNRDAVDGNARCKLRGKEKDIA